MTTQKLGTEQNQESTEREAVNPRIGKGKDVIIVEWGSDGETRVKRVGMGGHRVWSK